ncbi:MAG: transposase, partial [Oscillospiraceae bacterium]
VAMYGVSDTTAAQLMAEIGDVRRFAHKGSLTAFAGVDPGARQSGEYEAKSNRVAKSGCPELRRLLYQITSVLSRKAPPNEPVYEFRDRQRAERKPDFVYMTATANKFLRIYYGRVKEYLNALDEGDDA